MPLRPHCVRQRGGRGRRDGSVIFNDDERLSAELRRVGEGVANHHAGSERGAIALEQHGVVDHVAIAARLGDAFIAARQHRHSHPGDHRMQVAIDNLEQQVRSSLAGIREIDVWVGVVDRQTVDLAQHPIGEDAVKVQRNDERDFRAEQAADLGEEVALRIGLAHRPHRAVERDVECIHPAGMRGERSQPFGRQALPSIRGEDPGAAGAGGDRRHQFDIGAAIKHGQRTGDRGVEPAVPEEGVPALDREILVLALQRIEGGDLLHAFGHKHLHRQDAAALAS